MYHHRTISVFYCIIFGSKKKGSLSNVGVPFKSSTTDGRECLFLTSFFIVVLHETAIESVFGIC